MKKILHLFLLTLLTSPLAAYADTLSNLHQSMQPGLRMVESAFQEACHIVSSERKIECGKKNYIKQASSKISKKGLESALEFDFSGSFKLAKNEIPTSQYSAKIDELFVNFQNSKNQEQLARVKTNLKNLIQSEVGNIKLIEGATWTAFSQHQLLILMKKNSTFDTVEVLALFAGAVDNN